MSLAHVVRPLVLAQSLDPREYEIHFACDKRYQSLISAVPHIRYWPIRSFPSEIFTAAADYGIFPLSRNDLDDYVTQERRLLTELRPSLVISDFRFTVSISAALTNTPHAAIANVHWSPFRLLAFDANPGFNLPSVSSEKKGKFAKRIPATELINSCRQSYGVSSVSHFLQFYTGNDYTLYVDSPGLVETMPLPEGHFFLGPVLWSPELPKPTWWGKWNSDLPVVYLTLGSTGDATLLPSLIQYLQDLPVTILVATAGKTDVAAAVAASNNVYVSDFLPGMEAAHIAAVTICNGGSGTAYQALSQGTPVVGLWGNIDQYLTAMIVKHHGAGLCCRASDLDREQFRSMITEILYVSSFRAKAEGLSAKLRAHNAGEKFRNFVADVSERGSPNPSATYVRN